MSSMTLGGISSNVVPDRRVIALRPPLGFGRGWDGRLEELEGWLVLLLEVEGWFDMTIFDFDHWLDG